MRIFFLQQRKKWNLSNLFFLYKQNFIVHHSIEISLKISTNKLQERIQSDWYQITRPYPMWIVGAIGKISNLHFSFAYVSAGQ
jgi:hypothetical protein